MKSNPKLTALQVELAQVQHEIETLIDTLTGANPVLLSYVNSKIEEGACQKDSGVECGYHQPGTGQRNFRLSGYMGRSGL